MSELLIQGTFISLTRLEFDLSIYVNEEFRENYFKSVNWRRKRTAREALEKHREALQRAAESMDAAAILAWVERWEDI
jgi:hypothetical protein